MSCKIGEIHKLGCAWDGSVQWGAWWRNCLTEIKTSEMESGTTAKTTGEQS